MDEMDLITTTEEDENPADDPLLEPHPGEPGVCSDGTAAPLENPDDSVSADPLLRSR